MFSQTRIFKAVCMLVATLALVAFVQPQQTFAQDEPLAACLELSVVAGPVVTFPDGNQANIFSAILDAGSLTLPGYGYELYTPGETVTKHVQVTGDQIAFLSSSDGSFAQGGLFGNYAFWGGSVRAVDNSLCFGINDGRLNHDDMAALAAVYRASSGDGFEVWSIDPQTSKGTLLFTVSQADVNAVLEKAVSNSQNQTINSAGGIILYALSSNECQLNYTSQDGQPRAFTFACAG